MEGFRLEEFWFSLLRKEDLRELWHPELEIVFLLQGTGRVYFSDLKTAYTLREKDIFVVNSFEVQDFELDEDAAALSFFVSPGFVDNVAPELLKYKVNCRSFLYVEGKQPAFDVLRQDLARAFQALNKKEKSGAAYSKSSAAAILEDLSRYFLDDAQPVESGRVQETLKNVTQYIQAHYRERITLDELAKHTFLSKTYISRCFTRYLGIPFTSYLELLRLSSAARQMAGQGTLAQIAEESGFPNVNAMIQAFKRYRGVTPGEYRRTLNRGRDTVRDLDLPEEGSGVFAALLCYAGTSSAALPAPERVQELTVDTAGKKEPLAAHWKRLLNVGYARSLTDGRIQGELRRLQDTVGFEFLRIKGLLDDDMCLLRLDMNGSPVMNYTYVDEVLDFILSLGAKPMLELSFMPSLLAKTTVIRSMRGGILSGPRDLARWQELIGLLMEHLAERYGRERVARWLFSPWLAPDFIDVGLCSREEYAEVYAASCHAIRAAVPRALIVGPGSVNFSACWPWYLEMCRSRDQVFVRREPQAFYLRLKNLPEGTYQVCRYGITQSGGSAYDAWVRMGAPSPLSREERALLQRLACPQYQRQQLQTADGELHIKASLAPQDVWLIRIRMT